MVYCKKCGKILDDMQKLCPHCGYNNDDEVLSQISKTSTVQKFDQNTEWQREPFLKEEHTGGNTLANSVKVALSAVVCLIYGIGPVIGVIVGIIYMGKPDTDYKGFGKALLVLSAILLGITVLCCVIYSISFSAIFAGLSEYIDTMY